MKKILVVVVSLLAVSSVAFAKPSVESDIATISKADSQFLFQDGVKVVALGNDEMKSTQGEFGSYIWGVTLWGALHMLVPGYRSELW